VREEIVPGARVVRARVEPGQAVGHRVHAHQQLALEAEPGQIVGDRPAYEVDEGALQLWPDVAVGGLLDAAGLGEPGRCEVGPQRGDLDRQLLVGGQVAGREVFLHLRAGGLAVASEEQVRCPGRAGGGEEVVRVAAQHRDVHVERAQQFRRHQAQQVGPGGLAEAGHLGERPFGAGRPAQHVRRLENHYVEPGAGEQNRGDQAVVARSDDHYVGLRGEDGHEERAYRPDM
jgi:hypothetical protein